MPMRNSVFFFVKHTITGGAIWHGLTKAENWMERSSEKSKFENLLKNHFSKTAFSSNFGMMF